MKELLFAAAGFAGGIVFTLYALPQKIAAALHAEYDKLLAEAKAKLAELEAKVTKIKADL
jgi:hypothetical protein